MIATPQATAARPEKEPDVLVDQPWKRVRNPPPLDQPVRAEPLLALDEVAFAELVRGHLMPREDRPGGRAAWTQLWALLANHDGLAHRTFDALEDFLEVTEADLGRGGLDDAQTARARAFAGRCNEAWKRLQRDDDQPLGWAGNAAAGFNPVARKVIAVLVSAIARHRAAVVRAAMRSPDALPTAADEALWASLRSVSLDPDDYHARGR